MTKTLIKETLRSITKNKLRFISIVIIIALGLSFFIGIKSAFPEMRYKANDYFRENRLFDVRATSPLEIRDEDVEKIKQLDEVGKIEKSTYIDCILEAGGKPLTATNGSAVVCRVRETDTVAARAVSDTADVESPYMNVLVLKNGRMPEKSGECVIDSRAVKRFDGVDIGATVTLAGDEESIEDSFKQTEYEVVGTVSSPMYISDELGNSKAGAGVLGTFIYVYPGAFVSNECNELFISIKNSADYDKFSAEYNDIITKLSYEIRRISQGILDARLADFKADYTAKIADKENELSEYEKTSAEKLAAKQKEIDDFKAYVDSEDQILEEAQKDYEKKVSSASKELERLKKQLQAARKEYDEDTKSFDNQSSEIKGYSDLKALYDDLSKKHSGDKKTLDSLKGSLNNAKAKLDTAKAESSKYSKTVSNQKREVEKAEASVETCKKELADLKAKQTAKENEIKNLNSRIDNLKSDIAGLEKDIAALEDATTGNDVSVQLSLKRVQLTGKKSDLKTAESDLDKANSELKKIETSISKKNDELKSAQSAVTSAKNSLNKATANYNSSVAAVNSATAAYNNANSSYNRAKTSYDADSATLNKYKDSMNKLTSGTGSLKTLSEKIDGEKKKLDTLKVDVTRAQIKYTLTKNEGTVEIERAQYKLNAAKARYSTIDDEYTKLKGQTDKKIANLNGDLKKYRAVLKNADSMTWEATPQTALAGNKNFSRSLDNVHSISRVFPVLFLLTAMIACFVIMVRNIEEERLTIGIMKAIGYSNFSVFLKYVIYSVIAWTVGSLLGVVIGAIFFPAAVSSIYEIIYEIPSIGIVYNPWYVSYGLEASAAAVLAATIAATFRELVYKPATLLRAKNINFSRRVWLERFPGLWGKLNYGMIFVARAVSRSRRRLFVGTVGVACCTALILSAFGLANSADAVSGVQYSKNGVFKYDVQLTLRSAQTSGSSDIFESVMKDKRTENAMLISMDTANVSSTQYGSNENYSARIITFDDKVEAGEFVSFKIKEGSAGLDGGVLVSEKLAKNSGARVGESVYLTSADGSVHSVKINGVVRNYVNDYVYFSKQYYVETFNDEPVLKYIICNVKDYMSENDIAKFASDYLKLQDITGAATAKNMEESINDSMSRVMAVVMLFIISACVLAGIVMYTVANINISERVREVANIKVVGFSDNEVLLYVSRENIISTIFGLIIGIVFGIFFNSTLVSFISSDTVAYNESLYWWSYLATALIITVVAVLVSLPLVLKIKKINMAETMKSIEQYS